MELKVNKDLSFERVSIIAKLRRDLNVIAEMINDTAKALFNSCTGDQLRQVVETHPVEVMRPMHETEWVRISSIEVGPDRNWYFSYFDGEGSNEVSAFNIDDVLSVLETVEKVLYSSKQNKEKV